VTYEQDFQRVRDALGDIEALLAEVASEKDAAWAMVEELGARTVLLESLLIVAREYAMSSAPMPQADLERIDAALGIKP
jgi:hypothetical protein